MKIHTHATTENRKNQMCQCSNCGIIKQCTPYFDFYGKNNQPLICENCILKVNNINELIIDQDYKDKYFNVN